MNGPAHTHIAGRVAGSARETPVTAAPGGAGDTGAHRPVPPLPGSPGGGGTPRHTLGGPSRLCGGPACPGAPCGACSTLQPRHTPRPASPVPAQSRVLGARPPRCPPPLSRCKPSPASPCSPSSVPTPVHSPPRCPSPPAPAPPRRTSGLGARPVPRPRWSTPSVLAPVHSPAPVPVPPGVPHRGARPASMAAQSRIAGGRPPQHPPLLRCTPPPPRLLFPARRGRG